MTIDYDLYIKSRKLIQTENPRYHCEKCHEILYRPYQTSYGSRCCYSCVTISNDQIMPDKAIEKEISKLHVKCINIECEEILILKDLPAHLVKCNYRLETCDLCNELYPFIKKNIHMENKCQKKLIKCSHCDKELSRDLMEGIHKSIDRENFDDICDKWQRDCPNKCCYEIFDNIKLHLLKCSKQLVKCPFFEIGCQANIIADSRTKHLKDYEIDHFHLLTKSLLNLKRQSEDKKSQITQHQNDINSEIESIRISTLEVTKSLAETSEILFKQEQLVKTISDDIKIIETKQVENQNKKLSHNSISFENGQFLWIIPDIRQKIDEARNGNQTQLVSESFYTTKGYKMKLKIYPNGDGIALNRCISIFCILLKGNNDDNISWPFSKKVTISLEKNDHCIMNTRVVMKPDVNSVCYRKPLNDYNTGFGQPEFILINHLLHSNDYISNGSLRIRLKIE